MAVQVPAAAAGRQVEALQSGGNKGFWARYRLPYLYILPASIILAIVTLYPIAYGVYLSFTDYRIKNLRGRTPDWVWFQNYERIFKNELPLSNFNFWRIIGFNITWTITNVIFHVIFGIASTAEVNLTDVLLGRIYRFAGKPDGGSWTGDAIGPRTSTGRG